MLFVTPTNLILHIAHASWQLMHGKLFSLVVTLTSTIELIKVHPPLSTCSSTKPFNARQFEMFAAIFFVNRMLANIGLLWLLHRNLRQKSHQNFITLIVRNIELFIFDANAKNLEMYNTKDCVCIVLLFWDCYLCVAINWNCNG